MTKLHPPPRREQTVPRDGLVERLRARPEIKLTLIAAPPGFGKSTLLAMWRESEQTARPIAWLNLDEGDNDPVVLWSYAIAALHDVCPALEVSSSPEQVGPARIVDVVLPELVNQLTALGDAAIVLDDFHRISSGPARESVAWFIDNAPSTFQLVLATRSEPGLPLAALRAHGSLLELRAEELGFTPAEADVLLNDRLQLSLEREDVDDLVERTEGWPAGLYLAALSLQGVEDRHAFVSMFGGKNRHVVDFLVDEVLEAHDPQLQDLMLRSSIFERLSGPLCDAVLERDGSAELLDRLSRTNLFLLPLDEDGEWYRFHHLFAQLLRVELEHRKPGVAATLHHRAFEWHRDHGSVSEAIEHASAAGAFAEATELITAAWFRTLRLGRYATILGWLARFPPQLLRDSAPLLLIQAWALSLCGRREEAAAAIQALEQLGWSDHEPLPDGSSSLEASLATIRAAFPGGDVGTGYANALRAVELQSPESPSWPAACWPLGMCCYYRGDLEEAEQWFGEAAEAGPPNERWLITASSLAYLSLIAGDRGESEEQRVLAEDAAAVARQQGSEELSGEAHVAMGVSLATRGEPDEALPLLARGVAVARALGRPLELAHALIRQAVVLQATRRSEDATAAIDEARATVDACSDPGVLRERLQALERWPRAASPAPEAKLSERELVVLRMLRSPLSERDIGRELYLSHNTIHSHTRSIYRKLGVSSRAEALQRALALHLL
jgi:LuxR family transcriptional regulator, maltose regulon positive regulatory protein